MSSRAIVLALAAMLCAALPSSAPADPYTEGSPPGANDFACKPSPAHPNPVVLVHGLGATMQANWYWMSPRIAAQGYCVFALTYGVDESNPPPFNDFGGTIRMEDSALQLSAFVDRVLTATGAAKVDIVGHSEGSLMPDYYVRFVPASHYAEGPLAGQSKVDRYVGMTPLWNGTNVAQAGTLSEAGAPTGLPQMVEDGIASNGCASCPEFIQGSDFIKKMSSDGGPKAPGVTYTMIMTAHDELVQPYDSGRMTGATNIVVQDQCAADPSEHLALATNPNALIDVLNALDPAHARTADCTTLLNFS
jgi:pimeloyl-ACP methyl ester carboxylesterase